MMTTAQDEGREAHLREAVLALKADNKTVSEIAASLKVGRAKVREIVYGVAS